MTRRPLRPDEARLWSLVAATVRLRGTAPDLAPDLVPDPVPAPAALPPVAAAPTPATRPAPARPSADALALLLSSGVGARASSRPAARVPARHAPPDPGPIEPVRHRRIARAREPIGGRLDLHGHDQDRARAALTAFVLRAQADGARAVLVITGKGRTGDGVLRRRVPEWLGEAPARAAVAGVSPAEPRHGGDGALYVALKRR